MSIYFKDNHIRGNVTDSMIDTTVLSFIENSDVEFISQGLNGIGFSCNLKPDILESPFNILSLEVNNRGQCRSLFIKLQLIYPEKTEIGYPKAFDMDIGETTTREMFINEGTHNLNIYKQSNHKLEPICPPLIKLYTVSHEDAVKGFCNTLKHGADNEDAAVINYIKDLIIMTPNLELGISVFTFPDGFSTLQSIMQKQKGLPVHKRISIKRYEYFNLLIIIELLRLFDIGYFHNDIHTGNYLINPDYIYTVDAVDDPSKMGRCIIIDMGRVTMHTNSIELPIQEKLQIIYENSQKILVFEEDKKRNPYKWFKIMMDKPNIVELINNIEQSRHQNEIVTYSWLMETHSDIIKDIQDFNGNIFSVLKGGNLKLEETTKLLPIEQVIENKVDNTKSLIVKKSPEQIVNPDKVNITVLGRKYLNMLKEGEKMVLNLKKNNKPVGGKRKYKRKTRKNKKRNKKKKTNRKKSRSKR